MLAELSEVAYPAPSITWHRGPRPTDGTDDERILAPGVTVNWHNKANLDRPPASLFIGENWHGAARCFSAGLEMFFGDEADDNPRLKPTVLARAQALCRSCPVAAQCLETALSRDERYGVWGGASGRQRDKMRHRIIAGELRDQVIQQWLTTL